MDFLVAGLGFGAVLILAGYAVREFGAFLFAPGRVRKQFPDNAELAGSWRRFLRSASNVAMVGGCAMWLIALVGVTIDLSDPAGALAMAGTATVISAAGAGLIYFAYRRRHEPVVTFDRVQPERETAAWLEPQARSNGAFDSFEEWKPRVIGTATSTLGDEMPAWGASFVADEEPTPVVEVLPEPAFGAAGEEPVVSVPVASNPVPISEAAPNVAKAEAAEEQESSDVAVEPELDAAPAVEIGEAGVELVAAESVSEPEETEPEALLPDNAAEPAGAAAETVAETEPAPEDQLVSEAPAAPEQATDREAAEVPRRFKSSLLAGIDQPEGAEPNLAFKSSLLADLSSVRLPDDGPRYRSTALVDVAKLDDADDDASQDDSTGNRRS